MAVGEKGSASELGKIGEVGSFEVFDRLTWERTLDLQSCVEPWSPSNYTEIGTCARNPHATSSVRSFRARRRTRPSTWTFETEEKHFIILEATDNFFLVLPMGKRNFSGCSFKFLIEWPRLGSSVGRASFQRSRVSVQLNLLTDVSSNPSRSIRL